MSSFVVETPRKALECTKELQWLKEHRADYIGQWVALDGECLLAHGDNAVAVYEAALQKGIESPVLVQIQSEENVPFGGW